MKRFRILLVMAIAVVLSCSATAMAEVKTHKDGKGYTSRTQNSTYSYRYDSGATYQKYGRSAYYSDRSGTTGTSYYGRTYRYDSFQNDSRGWSGSGIMNYKKPYYVSVE